LVKIVVSGREGSYCQSGGERMDLGKIVPCLVIRVERDAPRPRSDQFSDAGL
jgi:hypothetical protein